LSYSFPDSPARASTAPLVRGVPDDLAALLSLDDQLNLGVADGLEPFQQQFAQNGRIRRIFLQVREDPSHNLKVVACRGGPMRLSTRTFPHFLFILPARRGTTTAPSLSGTGLALTISGVNGGRLPKNMDPIN